MAYDDLLLGFKKLSNLPEAPLRFHHYWAETFTTVTGRLAREYLDDPTEQRLFDILAFPKLAFIPAVARQLGDPARAKVRVTRYPQGLSPRLDPPRHSKSKPASGAAGVEKAIEAGRFSRAAKMLANTTPPLEVDEEVYEALRSKHPAASAPRPFGDPGRRRGERTLNVVDAGVVEEVVKRFKQDTAAGPSGWTVPMLRLALKADAFADFFVALVQQIQQGTAPCVEMLTAARLIALPKKPSGVRPIAVGEIFYRCAMKAIVRQTFHQDSLKPFQLGVGSKGGVEPVVRFGEQFAEGHMSHTHGVSLDFSNAFNSVARSAVAESTFKFAPKLYKATRWAYSKPSPLLLAPRPPSEGLEAPVQPTGTDAWFQELESAEGVRQGDPLGPALFSLAIRPL
ncbi:MAG: hypothetical protein EOO40_07070, partial [Deltaproteobacteria bacterium]